MRKQTLIGLALGVSLLLAAGGLFASNMGFKLNYPLITGDGGVTSASGTNTLALPFNQQTDLVDAFDLIQDINTTAGSGAVVQLVEFLPASDGLNPYDGQSGSAFPLTPAQAYQVQVNTNVNYIIVGSHDPGLVVNLTAPGPNSASGTNFYAYPYHSVAADAFELITEINSAAGSNAVVQIVEFLPASDGLNPYDGVAGSAFPLVPGQGYQVQVASNVSFVPAHY